MTERVVTLWLTLVRRLRDLRRPRHPTPSIHRFQLAHRRCRGPLLQESGQGSRRPVCHQHHLIPAGRSRCLSHQGPDRRLTQGAPCLGRMPLAGRSPRRSFAAPVRATPSQDALAEGPYRIDPVSRFTVVQEITNDVSRMSVMRTSTGVSASASPVPKVSGSTSPTQIKAKHTARTVTARGASRFTS